MSHASTPLMLYLVPRAGAATAVPLGFSFWIGSISAGARSINAATSRRNRVRCGPITSNFGCASNPLTSGCSTFSSKQLASILWWSPGPRNRLLTTSPGTDEEKLTGRIPQIRPAIPVATSIRMLRASGKIRFLCVCSQVDRESAPPGSSCVSTS